MQTNKQIQCNRCGQAINAKFYFDGQVYGETCIKRVMGIPYERDISRYQGYDLNELKKRQQQAEKEKREAAQRRFTYLKNNFKALQRFSLAYEIVAQNTVEFGWARDLFESFAEQLGVEWVTGPEQPIGLDNDDPKYGLPLHQANTPDEFWQNNAAQNDLSNNPKKRPKDLTKKQRNVIQKVLNSRGY